MPLILAPRGQRQADPCESQASLGYPTQTAENRGGREQWQPQASMRTSECRGTEGQSWRDRRELSDVWAGNKLGSSAQSSTSS